MRLAVALGLGDALAVRVTVVVRVTVPVRVGVVEGVSVAVSVTLGVALGRGVGVSTPGARPTQKPSRHSSSVQSLPSSQPVPSCRGRCSHPSCGSHVSRVQASPSLQEIDDSSDWQPLVGLQKSSVHGSWSSQRMKLPRHRPPVQTSSLVQSPKSSSHGTPSSTRVGAQSPPRQACAHGSSARHGVPSVAAVRTHIPSLHVAAAVHSSAGLRQSVPSSGFEMHPASASQ